MASSRAEANLSDEDNTLTEPNAASTIYAPWQTFSALATETGQAVKATFHESGVDTSGHVQQGLPYHVARTRREPAVRQNKPDDVPEDYKDSLVQPEATSSESADSVDQAAVQADITRVTRKIISTDAATEVVLRFNFLTSSEAKVRCYTASVSSRALEPDWPMHHCMQAALLCVAVAIIIGAGVLITEFNHKMEKVRHRCN